MARAESGGPDDVAGAAAQRPLPYLRLPGSLDDPGEVARAIFDRLARVYDTARPGYPPDAIAGLRARCGIGPASRVLEIGCGTGQATQDLARAGCAIRCLEPGPHLAELARRNLASYPKVQVVTTTFEAEAGQPGSYDAVVSATAFHWIDPRAGYPKAARLLVPGGCLALLTNAHVRGGSEDELAQASRDLYRRIAPDLGPWAFPSPAEVRERAEAGGDIAAVWSRVERKLFDPPPVSGLFGAPAVSTYHWTASYGRDAYLAYLSTQAPYAMMAAGRRGELLQGIGELADGRLGGTVTKHYLTVLVTAERRADASP